MCELAWEGLEGLRAAGRRSAISAVAAACERRGVGEKGCATKQASRQATRCSFGKEASFQALGLDWMPCRVHALHGIHMGMGKSYPVMSPIPDPSLETAGPVCVVADVMVAGPSSDRAHLDSSSSSVMLANQEIGLWPKGKVFRAWLHVERRNPSLGRWNRRVGRHGARATPTCSAGIIADGSWACWSGPPIRDHSPGIREMMTERAPPRDVLADLVWRHNGSMPLAIAALECIMDDLDGAYIFVAAVASEAAPQ